MRPVVALTAGVLAGLAVHVGGAGTAAGRRRVTAFGPVFGPALAARGRPSVRPGSRSAGRAVGPAGRIAAGASVVLAALVLGGVAAAGVAGAAFAVLDRRLAGAQSRATRARRARIGADLPAAADLLAACLAAGSPPAEAAEAVADAVGGPAGESLRRVVALLRLGGDPVRCWQGLGAEPQLAALGRAIARAVESGTPLAPVVAAEAAQCRAGRRLAGEAALARVGVFATAPLGLCFLPAFVLIGVVPVVLSLGANVLS